ncbi:MAG: hypothetical protein GWN07_23430, partial [Actinobacteria bacterium]|nr:hypothetical protein [Actinomycetota bacterium]NIU68371.1 hypothetical protein [Actinomycetota bacterium]NIW30195.1 hypothetical protein [Actinomycetota bacterium]NIX22614.1 hypothetical protein [Actinomycetota bacterium]
MDGGSDDGGGPGTDGGPTEVTCAAGERIALGVDQEGRERRVALAAGSGGTLAAWSAKEGVFTNVSARMLANDGSVGDPVAPTDDFA